MSSTSTAELMLRMVLSLAIMGGLLWLVLRLARSRKAGALLGAVGGRAEQIELCARRQLSRSSSVALVRVGERVLLLGVGEAGVQVLAEGDELGDPARRRSGPGGAAPAAPHDDDPEGAGTRPPGPAGAAPARMGVLDALRELTVRR